MNDLIMIVEDDPYISHFLQMSFEQEGYRILMTTKGHEALSLFYSHQPDIVILDLGLPDIDGLEVIQEIRKISSKPIIVVSARLEEQEKIKALDLGANDYVVKPFYMGELLARIRVFNTMLEKTQTEQTELKAKVSEGRKRLSDEVQLANDAKQWVEAIQEYANITELDAATLNRLIKEIVVHERIDEDKIRHISIEIHFNLKPIPEVEQVTA